MNLFSKEKDFILRILNFALILATLISIIVLTNGVINILLKDETLIKEKYEILYCEKDLENCDSNYENHKYEKENEKNNYYRTIFISSSTTITIAIIMCLVNKKKVFK